MRQDRFLYIGYMGHDLDISLRYGAQASMDGKPVKLDYPPVEQGFLYVPLSYFDRVLGFEVKYDPSARVVGIRLPKPRPLTLQECNEAYALLDLDALYDMINFPRLQQPYSVDPVGFNKFFEDFKYYSEAAIGWMTINPMFFVACREWESRGWRRYHAAYDHPELRWLLERGHELFRLHGPDRHPQYYTRPDGPTTGLIVPLPRRGAGLPWIVLPTPAGPIRMRWIPVCPSRGADGGVWLGIPPGWPAMTA